VDYVEDLRDNCCTAFAGIVQALCQKEHGRSLVRPHLALAWHLILQVSNSSSPDSLCASALALVGDLLMAYGEEVLGASESRPVLSLLERCRRSKSNRAKAVADWVSREVAKQKKRSTRKVEIADGLIG
jgi:hypothetical protein